MASFEDYDEFGNYIGADLESDEEEEELQQNQFVSQPEVQPLEGFDEEPVQQDDMALMEIDDGASKISSLPFAAQIWYRRACS